MAIDDNTVYGLYGSQIKDLAGKIEEKQDELTAGEGISITDESGALVISSTGGSGPTVVQTTGTSTTDVMSQNATTSMVYADPSTKQTIKMTNGSAANGSVAIGYDAYSGSGSSGVYSVAIGQQANTYGAADSVALGSAARVRAEAAISIGYNAGHNGDSNHKAGQIMLGAWSGATRQGEMNIGTSYTEYGFNSSNYRLISGVYDGQSAHDAATKGQLDSAVNALETELDAKQDVLTAGQNITIAEESGALVISATGGSGADAFTTNEWNALWA